MENENSQEYIDNEQYEQNLQKKEEEFKNQLNLTVIDEEAPKYWKDKERDENQINE